jgi:hypothetical protein
MEAAADTFADGTKVQNFRPPELLRTRARPDRVQRGLPVRGGDRGRLERRGYLV